METGCPVRTGRPRLWPARPFFESAVLPSRLVARTVAGGLLAGRVGGFSRRQSLNAGIALVAHGEFTIILADLASDNPSVTASQSQDLVAFAGLYVLVTATVGIVLMKESKRLGRALFPVPRLTGES